jgi:hypothetical protein
LFAAGLERMAVVLGRTPENPFDLGSPLKNLQQVMGYTVFDWLLPIKHSPCAGGWRRHGVRLGRGLLFAAGLERMAVVLGRTPCGMYVFAILHTLPGENPFDLGSPLKNLQQVMGYTVFDCYCGQHMGYV